MDSQPADGSNPPTAFDQLLLSRLPAQLQGQVQDFVELLEPDLPADSKNRAINILVQVLLSQYQSSPLPPPESLAGYQRVSPQVLTTIVEMARLEQAHRHETERERLRLNESVNKSEETISLQEIGNERYYADLDARDSKRGQIFALIITVLSMAGGCGLVLSGHELVGGVLGGAGFISVITTFIQGRQQTKKEAEPTSPVSN